ncbi:uncharacterized protein LOC129570648 [Sitodiplosis mosellana]|uniref:uncharacterized protein LOC129570648 n=1 Tax=Sitodiplosis mosellana TaxID=263140 RepID=UPI002443E0C3|nr:uncharacterized protein LOC129570648 [Sitodiplosis mosellana]
MSDIENQREMAMALQIQPEIFKLDVDCFEELFGWLSLDDLHAFGQTCKRMQQVAGHYFRLTYPGVEVLCRSDGIYYGAIKYSRNNVKINGFADYVENIRIHEEGSFRFAQLNEFKSLKEIYFCRISLTDERIACIKKFLGKAEVIEMVDCDNTEDLYERFLKYCTDMKHLSVKYINGKVHPEYDWMLQHYPKLEQLVLHDKKCPPPLDEQLLTTFFKQNTNIKHFAANETLLLFIRHSIVTSNAKFDSMSILLKTDENVEIRTLMNEFHEQEIYKELHLYVHTPKQGSCQVAPTVAGTVEKLSYVMFIDDLRVLHLVNLKELQCGLIQPNLNMESVADALVNLQRFSVWFANQDLIFALIRRSRKLCNISVINMEEVERKPVTVLDLDLWNKERGKLIGARKVTVYVDEKLFLATKEATQNKDYKWIEIKRHYSQCWIKDY